LNYGVLLLNSTGALVNYEGLLVISQGITVEFRDQLLLVGFGYAHEPLILDY